MSSLTLPSDELRVNRLLHLQFAPSFLRSREFLQRINFRRPEDRIEFATLQLLIYSSCFWSHKVCYRKGYTDDRYAGRKPYLAECNTY